MLLGEALWGECFDRLFRYQAVKAQFERTHFRVKDQKSFASLSSGRHELEIEIKTESYSLASERNVCIFQKAPFVGQWLQEETPREYVKVDSVPPDKPVVPTLQSVARFPCGAPAAGARRRGGRACAPRN